MFQKVLVIHSFRDSGTDARIAAAARSPDLDGLDLRHICIVDKERAPDAVAEIDDEFDAPTTHDTKQADRDARVSKAMTALIKEDFLPALRAEIAEQETELCLFHSGTVFSAYTGPLLQGSVDLSEEFPDILWALEDQSDWVVRHSKKADRLWGFEKKAVVAQRKHVSRAFTAGPEVNHLLRAVFG